MSVSRQLMPTARLSKRTMRTAAGLVAVVALGFSATGCGVDLAGSAAVIGDQRITDTQLTDDVALVTQALDLPASDQVNQVVLDRLDPRGPVQHHGATQ